MKKYIIIGFVLLILYLYINKDIYYIDRWHMYIKVENKSDTTTIYFSNSRWSFGNDYVKYCPQSAEISYLMVYLNKDTLYAREHYMKIKKIQTKSYCIKPVYLIHRDLLKGEDNYWSDSTYQKCSEWIGINHRHGIFYSWE